MELLFFGPRIYPTYDKQRFQWKNHILLLTEAKPPTKLALRLKVWLMLYPLMNRTIQVGMDAPCPQPHLSKPTPTDPNWSQPSISFHIQIPKYECGTSRKPMRFYQLSLYIWIDVGALNWWPFRLKCALKCLTERNPFPEGNGFPPKNMSKEKTRENAFLMNKGILNLVEIIAAKHDLISSSNTWLQQMLRRPTNCGFLMPPYFTIWGSCAMCFHPAACWMVCEMLDYWPLATIWQLQQGISKVGDLLRWDAPSTEKWLILSSHHHPSIYAHLPNLHVPKQGSQEKDTVACLIK